MTKALFGIIAIILSPQVSKAQDLHQIVSPKIMGDTLVIQGRIDGHIYDFLAREAKALSQVRHVELNSYGGNFEWAAEIAKKIRDLHVTTHLYKGNVCASSCVLLYAAGEVRQADQGTWFGIHGTRLSAGLKNRFYNSCFEDERYSGRGQACRQFLARWTPTVEKTTSDEFAFFEQNGVSQNLRAQYMGLADAEDWYEEGNLTRKPDYVLTAEEAYYFMMVTKLSSVETASILVQ